MYMTENKCNLKFKKKTTDKILGKQYKITTHITRKKKFYSLKKNCTLPQKNNIKIKLLKQLTDYTL